MPAAWRASRPPRPQVTAKIGGKAPAGIGQEALLDFQMELTLDGERLTAAEIKELLADKPEWLVNERATQADVRAENARLNARDKVDEG